MLPATPYRALYRLSCCGRRDLVAALRGGGGAVHLSVAAPPAGSLLEVWVEGGRAEVLDAERRCRATVAADTLPLTPELSLPVSPGPLAVLVSGRLPPAAVPWEGRPGWVAAAVDGMRLGVRVTGVPPRATGFELVGREGEAGVVKAVLSAHRGLVPGVLDIAVGGRTVRLELQRWEQGVEPAPPPWLSLPNCGGAT